MSTPDPFVQASPLRKLALTVRFLLELALLTGAGVLGSHAAGWPVAVLAVVVVAALWGLFLSPKAPVVLPEGVRLLLESALVLGVAAGLFVIGPAAVAGVGAGLWVVDRAVLALVRE